MNESGNLWSMISQEQQITGQPNFACEEGNIRVCGENVQVQRWTDCKIAGLTAGRLKASDCIIVHCIDRSSNFQQYSIIFVLQRGSQIYYRFPHSRSIYLFIYLFIHLSLLYRPGFTDPNDTIPKTHPLNKEEPYSFIRFYLLSTAVSSIIVANKILIAIDIVILFTQ